MHASRIDSTSSSMPGEAFPSRLAFRDRKSIDLTCSNMTNPVTPSPAEMATSNGYLRGVLVIGHAMHRPVCRLNSIVADDESRPAPALLVTGLRVERQSDQLSLPWDIVRHLPHLTADWTAPATFLSLVALRNTANEITQIVPAPHTPHGSHNEGALVHGHIHGIADINSNIGEQGLAQPKSLAVPPFLVPHTNVCTILE